jgi:TonB family protein
VRSLFVVIACYASVAPAIGQPSPDPLDKYKSDLARNPRNPEAHFRLGEAYLLEKDFQSAANEFREALGVVDQNAKWTEVWAHINLGKIFDITGRCAPAVNEYRWALRTQDDTFGAQAEIQDYLSTKIIRPVVRLPESPDNSGILPAVRRVGNDVVGPILLNKTDPEYSEAARLAGLEGTVLLKAVIALDGTATDIRVIRSLGLGLDEKAIEAVRRWRFTPGLYKASPAPVLTDLAVNFFLPARQSRWHMVGVTFHPSEGVSEPVFTHVEYPFGSGVARSAIDDARLVNAMRRFAAVRVSFDVNESGVPVHLHVESASEPIWGIEALTVLQPWRFKPGEKASVPVSVPGSIDLIWGERNLTPSPVETVEAVTSPDPPSDTTCWRPIESWAPRPRYTEEALQARREGNVTLMLSVGEDGVPRQIQQLSQSLGFGLDEEAIETVSEWRYTPARLNGGPVPSPIAVTITFRLPPTNPRR